MYKKLIISGDIVELYEYEKLNVKGSKIDYTRNLTMKIDVIKARAIRFALMKIIVIQGNAGAN